jgi:glyoxylase-like metal-dependent hydrolase (beta-lactamase superfamily II)
MTHLIGLVWGLIAAQALPAPAMPPATPIPAFEVERLADGVHGFVWKSPLDNPIQGNALFIINEGDVVVVDTGLLPSTARVMAAELRKLTSKPVRYVVNTHWHDDHHTGNAVYREVWPGVEFIGHRDTRADLIEKSYGERPKDLADMQASIERYERWAATGKDDDGKVLEERRRIRAGEIAALDRAMFPELKGAPEMPPDLTFVDQLVLQRGDRTIDVRWLGRGNTRGDTVVVLPKERIAATGDLLVHPVPFGILSYYEDWPVTLGRLDALPVDVLFPGHGPVMRDRAYLHQVQGLLRALVDRVKAAVAAGATLEAAQKQVTLADWKTTLAGDDPAKQRAFDSFFVRPAVERTWRQVKGEPDK